MFELCRARGRSRRSINLPNYYSSSAFLLPLQGVSSARIYTQGAAPGYMLLALQAVSQLAELPKLKRSIWNFEVQRY